MGPIARQGRKLTMKRVVAEDDADVADDQGVVAGRVPGDAPQVLRGRRSELDAGLALEDEDGAAVAREQGGAAVRRPGGAAQVMAGPRRQG
jgi:hypothetical protein